MKDYFLRLLETAAPEDGELQDAIECALGENLIVVTGDFTADVRRMVCQLHAIRAHYATVEAQRTAYLTQLFGPLDRAKSAIRIPMNSHLCPIFTEILDRFSAAGTKPTHVASDPCRACEQVADEESMSLITAPVDVTETELSHS